MIKKSATDGMDGMYRNLIKSILGKHTAHVVSGETLEAFPLRVAQDKGSRCGHSHSTQYWKPQPAPLGKTKKRKSYKLEEVKLSLSEISFHIQKS